MAVLPGEYQAVGAALPTAGRQEVPAGQCDTSRSLPEELGPVLVALTPLIALLGLLHRVRDQ